MVDDWLAGYVHTYMYMYIDVQLPLMDLKKKKKKGKKKVRRRSPKKRHNEVLRRRQHNIQGAMHVYMYRCNACWSLETARVISSSPRVSVSLDGRKHVKKVFYYYCSCENKLSSTYLT